MLLTAVPPTLSFDLQSGTGDSNESLPSDALISGSVSGDALAACPLVQIDTDGDGSADALVFADAEGEFQVNLGSQLEAGEHTIRGRAIQWSDAISDFLAGDWTEQTLTYEPFADSQPSIDAPLDGNDVLWGNNEVEGFLASLQSEPEIDLVGLAEGSEGLETGELLAEGEMSAPPVGVSPVGGVSPTETLEEVSEEAEVDLRITEINDAGSSPGYYTVWGMVDYIPESGRVYFYGLGSQDGWVEIGENGGFQFQPKLPVEQEVEIILYAKNMVTGETSPDYAYYIYT